MNMCSVQNLPASAEGIFEVRLVNVRHYADDKPKLVFAFEITEGSHKGCQITHRCFLHTEEARSRLIGDLRALGIDPERHRKQESDEMDYQDLANRAHCGQVGKLKVQLNEKNGKEYQDTHLEGAFSNMPNSLLKEILDSIRQLGEKIDNLSRYVTGQDHIGSEVEQLPTCEEDYEPYSEEPDGYDPRNMGPPDDYFDHFRI